MTILKVISDGELLVSSHGDRTARRWRACTGEAVGEPLRGHNGWVRDLAVSEDCNRIVSYSNDCDVRPWDALSGQAIGMPLRGHRSFVTCVAISRDGKIVLSGYYDYTVRQRDVSEEVNVTEQHLLSTVPYELLSYPCRRPISSLNVCGNGKLAVSGSAVGTVQRWGMLTGEAVGRPMLW